MPLVITPSEFVALTNQTLEFAMPHISVEGEISDLRISKGKWLYFKLKDDNALVSCFGVVHMMPGPLEDGMVVRVSGSPTLHARYGFSFQSQTMVPIGQGSINKAFELLRKKLADEGLMDDSRKRPVPLPPASVAVVTSAEGAAIADFTKILSVRWPYAEVIIFDSLVQGPSAPEALVEALAQANQSQADLLVVTRGGGGAEDLAAFNDERVVRAVASSRLPTVVAIGHENDESLSELVADVRASTPSNAAELISLDRQSELERLQADSLTVSSLLGGLVDKMHHQIMNHRYQLASKAAGLIDEAQVQLDWYGKTLQILNPSNVLARGYSMISRDGKVVGSSSVLDRGDVVDIRLRDGTRRAEMID